MGDPIVRQVVRIAGRVQAVGFRDRVLEIADDYRVAGTVRNLRPNDVLEIDVEGEAGEVDRFLEDVARHPPTFARIERIERAARQPRNVTGFTRAATGLENATSAPPESDAPIAYPRD